MQSTDVGEIYFLWFPSPALGPFIWGYRGDYDLQRIRIHPYAAATKERLEVVLKLLTYGPERLRTATSHIIR